MYKKLIKIIYLEHIIVMEKIVHNLRRRILNLMNIIINGHLFILGIHKNRRNYLDYVNSHLINNNKHFKKLIEYYCQHLLYFWERNIN